MSKDKKKGKLTKDDEKKDVTVTMDVYLKMFTNLGGLLLLAPFLCAISIFSYLEVYRDKQIKKWANKIGKD